MDMNRTFFLKKEERAPKWHVVDAKDQILGRLATQIADIIRGKDRAIYTPHTDAGDYVIVINCSGIKLTGDKWNQKIYQRYSGYRSGLKELTATQVFAKDPGFLMMNAVRGMLPKNKQSRELIKKLKTYAGAEHPHQAQV